MASPLFLLFVLALLASAAVRPSDNIRTANFTEEQLIQTKAGTNRQQNRWPRGVIPYTFDGSLPKNAQANITAAMADIMSKTCIKFVRKNVINFNYINIKQGDCLTDVGFQRQGAQDVCVSSGTMAVGTIVHKFLHVVGCYHEHARVDRDEFVTIYFENIQDGYEKEFAKVSSSDASDYGIPYNSDSIMHYGSNQFSKNGQPTITSTNSLVVMKAPSEKPGMTYSDARLVNALYGCL